MNYEARAAQSLENAYHEWAQRIEGDLVSFELYQLILANRKNDALNEIGARLNDISEQLDGIRNGVYEGRFQSDGADMSQVAEALENIASNVG